MLPLISITKHARFVLATKVICAAIAILLITMLVALPVMKPTEGKYKLTVSHEQVDENAAQKMQNPRFEGVDANNQPYNITADTATQQTKDNFLLQNINADISLAGGGWVSLSAKEGRLYSSEKIMDLSGDVHIFSDNGQEAYTESAHMDIKKNIISSNDPVHIQSPLGILDAKGFTLWQNEKRISFIGPVYTKIYMDHPTQNEGKDKKK